MPLLLLLLLLLFVLKGPASSGHKCRQFATRDLEGAVIKGKTRNANAHSIYCKKNVFKKATTMEAFSSPISRLPAPAREEERLLLPPHQEHLRWFHPGFDRYVLLAWSTTVRAVSLWIFHQALFDSPALCTAASVSHTWGAKWFSLSKKSLVV